MVSIIKTKRGLGLVALIILFLSIVNGCTNTVTGNAVADLSVAEFKELIKDDKVFVLDVHIPEQEHIEGTDAFIPYNEIESNLDKLPDSKDTKIAVYCRSGRMSEEASQKLIELDYKNVFNLVGGRNAYLEGGA